MTTSSYESLSHSKWDCKYHVVFIPKGRKKALYGKIRGFLGPVLRELAGQRGSTIVEGHMVQDHVHMLIRIPPKYAVAEVIGYIKGKSAIAVDIPNHLGHRILRRNSDEHVDMVLHHMPFHDGAPALPSQLTQHRPKKTPDFAIQRFLPAFRDKDYVIFTIPL